MILSGKINHTKEPWGRNGVATGSSNSWGCTQDKYIGYVTVVYTNSNKKIEVCTCVDYPCSDNSNIDRYETFWE